MASTSLNYQLKYLRPEELSKLEQYLTFLTVKDLGKEYYYKFSPDRSKITISESGTNIKTELTLDEFIDRAGSKVQMFLMFKDLDNSRSPFQKTK